MISIYLIIIFALGYLGIIFEHSLKISKSAFALFTGILMWLMLGFQYSDHLQFNEILEVHFSEISGILFFLLGAMTTVEIIDGHNGFDVITFNLSRLKIKQLYWLIGVIAFLLSAVLDNLTTTILMVSLTSKVISNEKLRWYLAGLIVIAANTGGAFSPIGDVTSTMLWIGGQLTAGNLIVSLLIPSVISFLIPSVILYFVLRKKGVFNESGQNVISINQTSNSSLLILILGITILLAVPLFKSLFHVPPYMGMMLGLGLIWIITEIITSKRNTNEGRFTVSDALSRIDTPSILFFFGILMAVSALQTAGILSNFATYLSSTIGNNKLILFATGLASAVIDNVPLVAAFQGMYPLSQVGTDDIFWTLLCYSAGTGGSILIIGSAAGVVAMGIENISFGWYFKKISWLALIGFCAGYIALLVL